MEKVKTEVCEASNSNVWLRHEKLPVVVILPFVSHLHCSCAGGEGREAQEKLKVKSTRERKDSPILFFLLRFCAFWVLFWISFSWCDNSIFTWETREHFSLLSCMSFGVWQQCFRWLFNHSSSFSFTIALSHRREFEDETMIEILFDIFDNLISLILMFKSTGW